MWKSLFLVCAAAAVSLNAAPVLHVAADRADALYRKGEPISFQISLTDEGRPLASQKVNWEFFGDDAVRGKGTLVTDAAGKAVLVRKLDRPGFMRCRAEAVIDGKKISGSGGAGVEPQNITPARPTPADFDAFWNQQKAELDALPVEAELREVPPNRPGLEGRVKVYDFSVACPGGRPVRGYLALPVGAKPKSLPGQIFFHGAGVGGSNMPLGAALSGRIAVDIKGHGRETGQAKESYQTLLKGELRNYRYDGCTSREQSYFRGMFRRLYRALQFLKSRPEWDGRILIATGTSQGGGQALVAAGLDPDVTCCVAHVPALCDHGGITIGRESGWPRFHWRKEGRTPEAIAASDYVDAVNFAKRIKNAECFLSTGFVDLSCTPSSVYAAFNSIPSPRKQIVNNVASDHTVPRACYQASNKFETEHIRKMRNAEVSK